MSEEWLEEIEERLCKTGYKINPASVVPNQFDDDMAWLIANYKKQAERVQELERSRKTLSDNHFQQIEQHKYLIQQNKRYRKALEFYADLKNWRKSHTERVNNSPSKVIADTGDKAREELESESE